MKQTLIYLSLLLFICFFFSCSSKSEKKQENYSLKAANYKKQKHEKEDEQSSKREFEDGIYSATVDYNNSNTGQNVSLDELISLRTQSLNSVGDFLVAKQWHVVRIREQTKTVLGYMSIHYGDSIPSPYINIEVSRKLGGNYIEILLHSEKMYLSYIHRLNDLKYNVISIVSEKVIIYESKANKTVMLTELLRGTSDDDKAVYKIAILDALTFHSMVNKK